MFEYEILLDGVCWIPIETSMINHPENIEKYIRNGILRKIEPIKTIDVSKQKIIIENARPIFICKLFINKNLGLKFITDFKAQITEYFENQLNDEYNILVIPIIDVYKEPEFQVLNVKNLNILDFEKFQKEINELLHIENHVSKCWDLNCENEINKEFDVFCSKECRDNNTTAG